MTIEVADGKWLRKNLFRIDGKALRTAAREAAPFDEFGMPPDILARARERAVDPCALRELRRYYADIGAHVMRRGSVGVWRLIATLHRLGLG